MNAALKTPLPIKECTNRKVMLPYQLEDLDLFHAQIDARGTAVCHWEQGLGKSLLSITLADERNYRRVLALGPAIGRLSWGIELDKWQTLPRKVIIINGAHDIKKLAKLGSNDPAFVVCTYDLCRREDVREAFNAFGFNFAILDEFQLIRNPTAKRTQATYALTEGALSRIENIMLMSGTPIVSWPLDMWPHLKRFAPRRIWNDETNAPMTLDEFRAEYHFFRMERPHPNALPVPRIKSVKNMSDLHRRLKGWAIRRRKDDVLDMLPPRITAWPLTPTTDARKIIRDGIEDLGLSGATIKALEDAETDEEMAKAMRSIANGSPEMSRIIRLTGIAKAAVVAGALKTEIPDTSMKYGILVYNVDLIDTFKDILGKFNPVSIQGRDQSGARKLAVNAFQNDPACRVFVGQIHACGTALTLTAGSEVIMAQRYWLPGDNDQAIARFHRYGQENEVNVRIPELAGTIDAAVSRVIGRRRTGQKVIENE